MSKIPLIWCDNISAISLAFNLIFHARIKYIGIDYHIVREKVAHKQLDVLFISTLDQVVDIFTKGLSSNCVHDLQANLCFRLVRSSLSSTLSEEGNALISFSEKLYPLRIRLEISGTMGLDDGLKVGFKALIVSHPIYNRPLEPGGGPGDTITITIRVPTS